MRRMMRIMKRHEGRFRLTESYANLSMQMLSAVKVIQYKQYRSSHPRHRIADQYRGELMVSWNYQEDPGKAHEADAAQCDQGWEQYVADPAERSGEYLDKHKYDVTRRYVTQHIDSDLHDIYIRCEDMIQRTAEDHKEDQKRPAYAE